MEIKEKNFLKNLYSNYYRENDPEYPYLIEKREFGMGFDKKIDFRHKSFGGNRDLKRYLIDNGPLFISYSVAYYRAPSARPMEAKLMESSDLVFDIDVHGCPYHDDNFVCDHCLSKAKKDTIYLIEEFLVPDFGISKNEISINFSGNRGYHVHILSEEYKGLNSKARRELTDYLTGKGFDVNVLCEQGGGIKSIGWKGRILRCIADKLKTGKVKTRMKDTYLNQLEVGILGRLCKTKWFPREVESCTTTIASNIDTQVTMDIYRLIRLPGSIHGGSSLIAKKVKNIDKFDPLKDAVWIDDEEVEVYTSYAPKMRLKDEEFGEIKNKNSKLPKYYAAYLISKGVARLL